MTFPFLSAAPLGGPWKQRVVSGVADWSHRDGATLCVLNSKRLLLIGGWDTDEPFGAGIKTTNQIWKSDNGGKSWEILLGHDDDPPVSGAGARFKRVHTPAFVTCEGYFYLIGGDAELGTRHSEVWRTSLDGDGMVWERRAEVLHVDWNDRILGVAGALGGTLYAMGGQFEPEDPREPQNDMYESTDGGATWTKLNVEVPWSPRGGVAGMPVIDGRIYLVGGGVYEGVSHYDGVFAFDGAEWETICEDGDGFGLAITGGRYYHNVVQTPDGRVWVVGGSQPGVGSSATIAFSDDKCVTWQAFANAEWGGGAGSHADGVAVLDGRIVRASGNSFDRATFTIARENVPEKPTLTDLDPTTGPVSTVVTLTGSGFGRGIVAVYVTGGGPALPAEFDVLSDSEMEVTMPPFPTPEVYFIVFGPGGDGGQQAIEFTYT